MMGTISGKSWEDGEQRKRYRCKRGCVWRGGGGDLVQSLLIIIVIELCKFQWSGTACAMMMMVMTMMMRRRTDRIRICEGTS
jgi:hypothetical protein